MTMSLLVVRNQLPFYSGPNDGGRYDLSHACSTCGTGAKRVDPIRLPTDCLPDEVSITLKFQVVVPPRLIDKLRAICPKCLREIHDVKTGATSQFYELTAETTLPRFSSATTGYAIEMQCPVCKRDGYFNVPKVPLLLAYDQELQPFQVAETYEAFGNSRLRPAFKENNFAAPYLVLGRDMQKVLENEPGIEFYPVPRQNSSERG